MCMTMEDVINNKDNRMFSEKNRLATFKYWPLKEGLLTKESMAKAGFYHISKSKQDDTVRCFCCFKELGEWSSTDDPWKEHLSHNNKCIFAQIGKEEKDLTLDQYLQVLEHREINLLEKRYDYIKIKERKMLEKLSFLEVLELFNN